jgi:spore germination cell wall hydrolase CwlJ-like protein
MALGVSTSARKSRGIGRVTPAWAWLTLILPMASCVPAAAVQAPALALGEAAPLAQIPDLAGQPALAGAQALIANSALPVAGGLNPAATSYVFRAATSLDQLRSLDCLAQAVYYEARSESEDGQRAVAQVVINRVRHPAWPNSVCGVVYQGPMRAGGGCQFTFTCDGSLRFAPSGAGWENARRIAAAALAGSVYAPVGYATHYHTQQVVPTWAYKLVKAAVVGSHSFYRMQGVWGIPSGFSQHYAGREPSPAVLLASRPRIAPPPALAYAAQFAGRFPAASYQPGYATDGSAMPAQTSENAPQAAPNDNLPQSRVREEYRNSGMILSDVKRR